MALWSGAGSAAASTERDPVVVGDASAIEAGVEVRGGADAPFVRLEAVEPVAVGDGVRTDVTGFAEIAYLDGSRTRLDIDTEFEVVELTDDAGVSTTRTSMGVGRTWHRVESLGEGEFTVETSQATATVRGTAFVLDCVSAGNCSYVVFEGVIEVALGNGSVIEVIGPAKVEVVGGVAGPVIPVTLAELLADPWLVANVKRDIGAGFGDLVTTLGTDEAEPTTTELATTSTTTADTSTTTTEPSTTEESTSTTTADTSATTTTESSETTTTEAPETTTTEPETTTTEPETTTTEPETTTTEPETTTTSSTTPT
ncbi:MAG: FecR family protein, partial [Ilumatobacteraceae bacterium]